MTGFPAVSAVIRSYPQFRKQTADFRRSCFPPVGRELLRKSAEGSAAGSAVPQFILIWREEE